MIAKLTFTLPDEEQDLLLALTAQKMQVALQEMDQHLRQKIKYEDLDEKVHEELEQMRSKLHELCGEFLN